MCGKEMGPKYSKENTNSLFFSDGTGCFSGGCPADFLSCSSSELYDIVGE